MKLEPIQDLSSWLPPLGESSVAHQKDVHVIVGDYILQVIPAILSYRSEVFRDWIQKESDLVCNEFKGYEDEFHQCLQILYGAEIHVTPTNASIIYKFGHLYQISEMVSEVKRWISSDLQESDFVTTLISFQSNASSVFDEFDVSARELLVNYRDIFPDSCFNDVFKVKDNGSETVITFSVMRLAKKYFITVTKVIIKILDLTEMKWEVFVLKKYMELLSSPDFWKYDFDKAVFSELCCTLSPRLEEKEDFTMLFNMMNLVTVRITPDDYNQISSSLVQTLTMKATTKDQILDFVQKSNLNKFCVIEIVTKWLSVQDIEVLKNSIHISDEILDSINCIDGYLFEIYEDYIYSEINKNYTEKELSQFLTKKAKNQVQRRRRRNIHIYFYLVGEINSIFDHPPTLQELSRVSNYCGGFFPKPHSVPQYDIECSGGHHFCLRYKINDQESMYSFITGEAGELERILGEASWSLLIWWAVR